MTGMDSNTKAFQAWKYKGIKYLAVRRRYTDGKEYFDVLDENHNYYGKHESLKAFRTRQGRLFKPDDPSEIVTTASLNLVISKIIGATPA